MQGELYKVPVAVDGVDVNLQRRMELGPDVLAREGSIAVPDDNLTSTTNVVKENRQRPVK